MINTTALRHPVVRRNIINATIHVIRDKYSVEHVANADGVPYLAIRQVDGKLKVTDRYHNDVTQYVAQSF